MDNIKIIPKFPDYAITKNGEVFSIRTNVWLKSYLDSHKYFQVSLFHGGVRKDKLIHHLVLETFGPQRPAGMECRHLDGNRQNNSLDNLVWGTHQENINDRAKHGTTALHRGVNNGRSKLNEEEVRHIYKLYKTRNYTLQKIANIFGVDLSVVWKIGHRKSWKHLLLEEYK